MRFVLLDFSFQSVRLAPRWELLEPNKIPGFELFGVGRPAIIVPFDAFGDIVGRANIKPAVHGALQYVSEKVHGTKKAPQK